MSISSELSNATIDVDIYHIFLTVSPAERARQKLAVFHDSERSYIELNPDLMIHPRVWMPQGPGDYVQFPMETVSLLLPFFAWLVVVRILGSFYRGLFGRERELPAVRIPHSQRMRAVWLREMALPSSESRFNHPL